MGPTSGSGGCSRHSLCSWHFGWREISAYGEAEVAEITAERPAEPT